MADEPKRKPFLSRAWGFYFNQFLTHFCFYPLLPLVILLMVALGSGYFADTLGVRQLFFHDRFTVQVANGMCLTFVVMLCLLVGYLLQSIPRESGDDTSIRFEERFRYFTSYAMCIIACMVVSGGVLYGFLKLVDWAGNGFAATTFVRLRRLFGLHQFQRDFDFQILVVGAEDIAHRLLPLEFDDREMLDSCRQERVGIELDHE